VSFSKRADPVAGFIVHLYTNISGHLILKTACYAATPCTKTKSVSGIVDGLFLAAS
jgi:hypothetical protein